MLYGVNNIAEIDEEKAKKLSEDLDLLDGLRLSVQHCKEVMEANKDRYPILERNYTILQNTNEELKQQIEEVNNMIAKFDVSLVESIEEAKPEDVNEETTVETEPIKEESVEQTEVLTESQPESQAQEEVKEETQEEVKEESDAINADIIKKAVEEINKAVESIKNETENQTIENETENVETENNETESSNETSNN